MTSQTVTAELLDAIVAAFNAHDVPAIVQYFADDAIFYMASGPEPVGLTIRGKAAIARTLEKRFDRIPDLRWDGSEHHIIGNYAVSVWRVRGHEEGGTTVDVRGCDLWEFENGVIVSKDTYWKHRTEAPMGLGAR